MGQHRKSIYTTYILFTEVISSHISVSGKDNISSNPITTLILIPLLDLGVEYTLTILSNTYPIQQLSSCSSKDTVNLHDDQDIFLHTINTIKVQKMKKLCITTIKEVTTY